MSHKLATRMSGRVFVSVLGRNRARHFEIVGMVSPLTLSMFDCAQSRSTSDRLQGHSAYIAIAMIGLFDYARIIRDRDFLGVNYTMKPEHVWQIVTEFMHPPDRIVEIESPVNPGKDVMVFQFHCDHCDI